MASLGFYFARLEARGRDRATATLSFHPGLNVISGASDTGKSYLLDCLDYMTGGGTAPKDIEESKGYESLWLEIRDWENNPYTLERSLRGGDFRLYRLPLSELGTDSVGEELKAKHRQDASDSLSAFLLTLCGLGSKRIRKNARNETRSVSFRDMAHLCIINEERIYTTKSPVHATGQHTNRTAEESFFRFLLTGVDDSSVIIQEDEREAQALRRAKIQALEEMVATCESNLTLITPAPNEVQTQLVKTQQTIDELATTLSVDRSQLRESSIRQQQLWEQIQKSQARQQILARLLNRFKLLERHYTSDLERLRAIGEASHYLSDLPTVKCPICGSNAPWNRPGRKDGVDLSQVQLACESESRRIELLQQDLARTMEDVQREAQEVERSLSRNQRSYDRVVEQIDRELIPAGAINKSELNELLVTRSQLERAQSLVEQIVKMRVQIEELGREEKATKRRASSDDQPTSARTSETEKFCKVVEKLLEEWNFPDRGRVTFSEDNQDLVINGQDRKSHGKGIRALTYSAFIVSLLRFCRKQKSPHTGFVVMDSCLVAYREPDTSAEVRQLKVKDAFYASLSKLSKTMQVIVFENEEPPTALVPKVNHIHFSKIRDDRTRYGFFPPLPIVADGD